VRSVIVKLNKTFAFVLGQIADALIEKLDKNSATETLLLTKGLF
jgi:hypothetical protein